MLSDKHLETMSGFSPTRIGKYFFGKFNKAQARKNIRCENEKIYGKGFGDYTSFVAANNLISSLKNNDELLKQLQRRIKYGKTNEKELLAFYKFYISFLEAYFDTIAEYLLEGLEVPTHYGCGTFKLVGFTPSNASYDWGHYKKTKELKKFKYVDNKLYVFSWKQHKKFKKTALSSFWILRLSKKQKQKLINKVHAGEYIKHYEKEKL